MLDGYLDLVLFYLDSFPNFHVNLITPNLGLSKTGY